jgi:nicotinate-nucleotide adenylyltransferase
MTERRRRVALYGGTFDPVHEGHMAVARGLLWRFTFDEVLFIPAHVAPHKRERHVTPALDRYAMLALATQDEARLRVSTVELSSPGRPYTINTLAHFCETTKDETRLFFVMGADSWEEITTWREWERVLTLTNHIVVTRPGYALGTSHVTEAIRARIVDVRGQTYEQLEEKIEATKSTSIFLTDAVSVDAAATDVRAVVRRGEWDELEKMVAPGVAEYIKKYGLYRGADGTEFSDAGNKKTN